MCTFMLILSYKSLLEFCAECLQDLHSFDPNALVWTDLSSLVTGIAPAARYLHGFVSDSTRLYVYGGYSSSSNGEFAACHSDGLAATSAADSDILPLPVRVLSL